MEHRQTEAAAAVPNIRGNPAKSKPLRGEKVTNVIPTR
jgi:hypothetical protein